MKLANARGRTHVLVPGALVSLKHVSLAGQNMKEIETAAFQIG